MEKISSPRERRKWSLGLGQHLKGASPNWYVRSHNRGELKKRNHNPIETLILNQLRHFNTRILVPVTHKELK